VDGPHHWHRVCWCRTILRICEPSSVMTARNSN
jgi:hypothetical protein